MSKSPYLTTIEVFNINKLLPGTTMQLISASHGIDDEGKKYDCIVKSVKSTEITLFIAKLAYKEPREFEYEIEEKTFPVDAFIGTGCYKLIPKFTEDEWKSTNKEL